MAGATPDLTTLFVRQAGRGGHAITPYAIEDRGSGVYWVKVYDNNHPDDASRHVEINARDNIWSYDLGWTTWRGDASTHTLGIVPITKYAEPPVCPWCSGITTLSGTPAGQMWLTGLGHLLIIDAQERRIGYVGNKFVNEIPGAYESIVDGGLEIGMEPIYTLPLTQTYTIMLYGQTLTQTETVTVSQFGPGYAVAVERTALQPASQDQLTFAADGTQVTYQPSGLREPTLVLAFDGATESYQLQIIGADVDAGEVAALTADVDKGQLGFGSAQAGGGNYDLDIVRIGSAGKQRFFHAHLVIDATDTHYFEYASWDGSGPMTLHIDHGSDGMIDETIELENEANRIYLPFIVRTE
jgi:hypothetical protein